MAEDDRPEIATDPTGDTAVGRSHVAPPDEADLTPGQRVLLDVWATGLHAKTRRLLHHLVVHYLFYLLRNGGFVPLSARYIRGEFRQAEPELAALVGAGVLQMRRHDRARGLSREYRIDPAIAAAFHAAALDDMPDVRTVAPREIVRVAERATGGAVEDSPAVTALVDEHGEPYPDLVDGALRVVVSSPVDLASALEHLDAIRDAFVSAETAHGTDSREFRRAFGRFVQARSAVRSVLRQRPTPTPDGLHVYDVALAVQGSGRLTEVAGGLQSAPSGLKAAARGGIPGVRNVDLPSAQTRFALVRMEAEGLRAPALERYVADPSERGRLGDTSGLGAPGVKRVVLAALMGAAVPTPEQALLAKGRLSQAVLTASGVDWEEWVGRSAPYEERLARLPAVRDALARVTGALDPLLAEFARWHGRLRTFRVGAAAAVEAGPSGPVVRNRLGMPLGVGAVDGRLRGPDLGRLVAHLLQGDEAAYVHSLTVELDRAGVRVVGNEHDGLVVIGEVPREVEERAAAAVGLPYVGVIEKPFV